MMSIYKTCHFLICIVVILLIIKCILYLQSSRWSRWRQQRWFGFGWRKRGKKNWYWRGNVRNLSNIQNILLTQVCKNLSLCSSFFNWAIFLFQDYHSDNMLQGSPHHNNLIRNSSSAALSSFNDMKKESPSISSTSSLASLGSGMPTMDLNHSSLTSNPLHSYTSQMHHVMKDAKMNVASPYGHYNHHQSSAQRPSITDFFGKMMSFSSCHQSSAAAAAAMTPSAAAVAAAASALPYYHAAAAGHHPGPASAAATHSSHHQNVSMYNTDKIDSHLWS